jgi:glycine/D-amino acid oxidase-like deaminating enzyme
MLQQFRSVVSGKRLMSPSFPPKTCEIVIVGAGTAGASAGYHLSKAGVRDIVILDSGKQPGEGLLHKPSGTAVMLEAPTIKMMIQLYGASSKDFIARNGIEGAHKYLSLASEGLRIQKELAKSFALDSPSAQMRELGSFYIGYESEEQLFVEEFQTLQSLGCRDIIWYDKAMLADVPGCSPDFHCAIYFPNDAIIDSSAYTKGLIRKVEQDGSATIFTDTTVTGISEKVIDGERKGIVNLASGDTLECRHVVIATGGLFQLRDIAGVLKPCYSYLVHVPVEGSKYGCDNSSNFFTWQFAYDWCFTEGKVRTSGEDGFSALEEPKVTERNIRLMKWTVKKYGCDESFLALDDIPNQFGVYTETPDGFPLIGSINPLSNTICYLLGCNALGQSILSYSSSLIPGILGYKSLTDSQKDTLKFISVQRFSLETLNGSNTATEWI